MRPVIHIDLATQTLTLRGSADDFSAPISSGRNGMGFDEGSGCTPTGRFCICTRHGEQAPLHTVFRNRLPIGTWPEAATGSDVILARILCLDGLEPANANTRSRYIYIHGTPDIDHLGIPVSHGCIRMAPADVARLYQQAPLGTEVVIRPAGASDVSRHG